MPRSSMRGTGAKPLASFMFDTGFVATVTPRSARMSKSSPSIQVQCAAVVGTSNSPRLSKYCTGVMPLWRSLHSSCSERVSETCTCMRTPASFAASASVRTDTGFVVYSACTLKSTMTRPPSAPWSPEMASRFAFASGYSS